MKLIVFGLGMAAAGFLLGFFFRCLFGAGEDELYIDADTALREAGIDVCQVGPKRLVMTRRDEDYTHKIDVYTHSGLPMIYSFSFDGFRERPAAITPREARLILAKMKEMGFNLNAKRGDGR